ncbi:hypothetical protein ACFCXT_26175 [Streptomyces vinaceus]|uniref:hypothetical protein n=1 Tax=Streptomyces vinaceus TaxID=1960 RepID=UPI0035DA57A5
MTALADHLAPHGLVLEMLAGPLAGIYDPTGHGRLLFAVFAAMAETERENIRESTLWLDPSYTVYWTDPPVGPRPGRGPCRRDGVGFAPLAPVCPGRSDFWRAAGGRVRARRVVPRLHAEPRMVGRWRHLGLRWRSTRRLICSITAVVRRGSWKPAVPGSWSMICSRTT